MSVNLNTTGFSGTYGNYRANQPNLRLKQALPKNNNSSSQLGFGSMDRMDKVFGSFYLMLFVGAPLLLSLAPRLINGVPVYTEPEATEKCIETLEPELVKASQTKQNWLMQNCVEKMMKIRK